MTDFEKILKQNPKFQLPKNKSDQWADASWERLFVKSPANRLKLFAAVGFSSLLAAGVLLFFHNRAQQRREHSLESKPHDTQTLADCSYIGYRNGLAEIEYMQDGKLQRSALAPGSMFRQMKLISIAENGIVFLDSFNITHPLQKM